MTLEDPSRGAASAAASRCSCAVILCESLQVAHPALPCLLNASARVNVTVTVILLLQAINGPVTKYFPVNAKHRFQCDFRCFTLPPCVFPHCCGAGDQGPWLSLSTSQSTHSAFPFNALPLLDAASALAPSFFVVQVIKGPVTKYFPVNAKRIGFSVKADLHPMEQYVRSQLEDTVPVVFVVGAFAHGAIDTSYVDEEIAVSQYPLSAAYALARVTNAMEQKWGIV